MSQWRLNLTPDLLKDSEEIFTEPRSYSEEFETATLAWDATCSMSDCLSSNNTG